MAEEYVITKKGRVVLPKSVLDKLGVTAGDKLAFNIDKDSIRIKKVKPIKLDKEKLLRTAKRFAEDLKKIRPHIKEAEEALSEGFSRHFRVER
jgi:AbrB family looped-hinge helix DNA binding protein